MIHPKILVITVIALGGAFGALSRFAIGTLSHRWFGNAFPYGTLIVNLIGCYLFGVLMTFTWLPTAHHWRAALTTGFLGALTTFSTFGYETVERMQLGQWRIAVSNVLLSVSLGLLAVWLGMTTVRVFWHAGE